MVSTATGTTIVASWPTSSARVYPNCCSSARLTDAMRPSRSMIPTAAGSASKACWYSLVSSWPESATNVAPLLCRIDGQAHDVRSVVFDHEGPSFDGDPGGWRQRSGTGAVTLHLEVDEGEVIPGRL